MTIADNHRSSNMSLLEQLTASYFQSFLPLVIASEMTPFNISDQHMRLWENGNGKSVLFLPPPANLGEDPNAKPERLGRVIKRLAECYRLNLAEKTTLANEVLQTLLSATDDVAVAFSGGRDSLVALHLMRQFKPDVCVVLTNTGIEYPESLAYVRSLAKTWNLNYHEVKPTVNFWELSEEQGVPVAGRGNTTFMRELSETADVKLSNSCCHRMKETPARQFYKQQGIKGVVTGLRITESRMRKMNFADYGALRYSSTYNALISWPLYAWSEVDIQAYISEHQLPINPLYRMGYQRVGCWPCLQDMLYTDSRLFTLQREHPKLYATLQKKFGDKMVRILSAWAGIDPNRFDSDDLDSLYRPCMMELFEETRKDGRRATRSSRSKPASKSPSD